MFYDVDFNNGDNVNAMFAKLAKKAREVNELGLTKKTTDAMEIVKEMLSTMATLKKKMTGFVGDTSFESIKTETGDADDSATKSDDISRDDKRESDMVVWTMAEVLAKLIKQANKLHVQMKTCGKFIPDEVVCDKASTLLQKEGTYKELLQGIEAQNGDVSLQVLQSKVSAADVKNFSRDYDPDEIATDKRVAMFVSNDSDGEKCIYCLRVHKWSKEECWGNPKHPKHDPSFKFLCTQGCGRNRTHDTKDHRGPFFVRRRRNNPPRRPRRDEAHAADTKKGDKNEKKEIASTATDKDQPPSGEWVWQAKMVVTEVAETDAFAELQDGGNGGVHLRLGSAMMVVDCELDDDDEKVEGKQHHAKDGAGDESAAGEEVDLSAFARGRGAIDATNHPAFDDVFEEYSHIEEDVGDIACDITGHRTTSDTNETPGVSDDGSVEFTAVHTNSNQGPQDFQRGLQINNSIRGPCKTIRVTKTTTTTNTTVIRRCLGGSGI